MEVTVIITTWGTAWWRQRGEDTAAIHDGHHPEVDVHHHHSMNPVSAGSARNAAVAAVDPPGFICFLDADDHLGHHYLQAMMNAHEHDRQLLTPALALGNAAPRVLDDRDIINGNNPCPIGTLIHRDLFEEVDGFGDEPAWEDFAMFQRAVLIGAEIRFVPDAIYYANHDPRGRNSTVRNPTHLRRQIQRDNKRWAHR